MRPYRKPISSNPSKYLTKFAEEIAANPVGPIIDVACGYGRNAIYLSSFGVPVTCIDNNKDALTYIESLTNSSSTQTNNGNQLATLCLDLINDPWPFGKESLGAIISVHFLTPKLLDCFLSSLKAGGYLFIETIDGHGENYLHLLPQNFIKDKLDSTFEIRFIKEKKVGPPQSNAATVKLFAQKQRTQ